MLSMIRTKTSPIGLDIGFDSVKMLQLQSRPNKIAVIAADEAQLDHETFDNAQAGRQDIISAITDMTARSYFSTKEVISCLPSSDLIIKSLRIDSCEDSEVEKILESSIVERCGLSHKTHEIRPVSMGNILQGNEIKKEIILFAATKQALDAHVNMIEQAGLIPVGIDTVPCALFRSLQRSLRRAADRDKTNVFVDIGCSHTTVIIGKAGEIIFAKQISIADEHINRLISSKLGIGFDETIHLRSKLKSEEGSQDIALPTRHIVNDSTNAVINDLAREISLCLRYYSVTFRGKKPNQIVFAGGRAYENILIDTLKRHLEVDIEITEPLRGLDLSEVEFPSDKRAMLCDWAVATGLSLKGIGFKNKRAEHERD